MLEWPSSSFSSSSSFSIFAWPFEDEDENEDENEEDSIIPSFQSSNIPITRRARAHTQFRPEPAQPLESEGLYYCDGPFEASHTLLGRQPSQARLPREACSEPGSRGTCHGNFLSLII